VSSFSFKELSLLEAESQLVGRCLLDGEALHFAISRLPLDCWRSEQGEDLGVVFYALCGRYARGSFDPERNEDELALGLPSQDKAQRDEAWWADWLDSLWCPWTAAPSYLAALVQSLADYYSLQNGLAEAYRRLLDDAPLLLDGTFEDGLFLRLREAIARRRERRYRKQTPANPEAAMVDWESVRKRAKA